MAQVKLSVLVEDDHLPKFSDVVKRVKQAGMKVENELETIGIITGSVDEAKVTGLKAIKGVAQVEQEGSFQIPPPDSDVQ